MWDKLGKLRNVMWTEVGEPSSVVIDNNPQVRDGGTREAREELPQAR